MPLKDLLVPILFVIIFFLAFIGNGIIAFKILRHRKMLNITNIYILSLAFANLLFIVTGLPFFTQFKYWPWGSFICKLSATTNKIFVDVSAFTLIALSVERYTAIVKPMGILQTRSLTVFTVILIWVVTCILASPEAIYNNVSHEYTPQCYMNLDLPFEEIYQKVNAMFQAVVCILLLCISITFYVLTAKKRPATQTSTHDGLNLARAVMICAVVFFVCLAPMNIFWLLFFWKGEIVFDGGYDYYEKYWLPISLAAFCLRVFQSCTMPIILYCMGGYNFHYLYYRFSPQTAPGIEMFIAPLREERL